MHETLGLDLLFMFFGLLFFERGMRQIHSDVERQENRFRNDVREFGFRKAIAIHQTSFHRKRTKEDD